MILARISTRIEASSALKRRGDVLYVTKPNGPTSRSDHMEGLTIEIEDDDLELIVPDDGLLPKPYASGDVDDYEYLRSTKYLDIDAMPADLVARILDPLEIVDTLDWATVQPFWGEHN